METIDRIKNLIEKGYSYNPKTGEVFNPNGKLLYNKTEHGYLKIWTKFGSVYQHQFAWYCIHKEIVDCLDHINKIRNDNRICNLRSVTQQQNQFNRETKGYTFIKLKNKFRANIMFNGKNIHLGYYNTEDEARQSYLQAKEEYHII